MMHHMPTPNPRLTITLTPTTSARMRRMSELTGNSQSSMISELLDSSGQVFDRLILILEAANTARETVARETVAGLERAQGKIEHQLGLVLEHMDEASKPLLEQAEAIRRRTRRRPSGQPRSGGRAAGGASAPTPISNRGVRSDLKTGEKLGSMRVPADLVREKRKSKKALDKVTVKGVFHGPV